MHASVRAFLAQIIDYAGLFPPAKLPLDEALRNYLHYRKASPHRWMLGRFVCPTTRLQELLTLAKAHEDASLLTVTALGQQSTGASEFLPQLEADIQTIQNTRQAWGQESLIETLEFALPKGAAIEALTAQMTLVEDRLQRANLRGFLEVPFTASWRGDVEKLCAACAHRSLGLKLRCGGVTAAAFPSVEQVAFFIDRCRSANLLWKATAGLHHPRGHWDESLQVWHHGFVNVFGAGLLAQALPLSAADMCEILADRAWQHFRFDADRFAWKDWACTTAQIAEFRASSATSFGSCSFEEPCADLTALGLVY